MPGWEIALVQARLLPLEQSYAHFSSSASSKTSNVSSHPTSTRILIPPSSSRIDCDALEDENCAPRRGVKVNILKTAT